MVGVHGCGLKFILTKVGKFLHGSIKVNYFSLSLTRKSKKNYHGVNPRRLQRAYEELTKSLRRAYGGIIKNLITGTRMVRSENLAGVLQT